MMSEKDIQKHAETIVKTPEFLDLFISVNNTLMRNIDVSKPESSNERIGEIYRAEVASQERVQAIVNAIRRLGTPNQPTTSGKEVAPR